MTTRDERIREASHDRRERERARTRRLILDTAEELMVTRGYADLSLREVAERIGYSPAALYRYFEDKDQIVSLLTEEGFDRFTEVLRTAYASTDDPLDRLDAMFEAYLGFARAHPVHYRLMFIERVEHMAETPRDLREDPPESLRVLYDAVQEGMERGAVVGGSVEEVGNALWAAVHGVAALVSCMEGMPPEWKRSMGEGVRTLLRRGVGSSGSARH